MKVGILGLAHGHVGTYTAYWKEHPELDIQVVRAWDHDETRLNTYAEKFGFEKGMCPHCVVDDPEIEGVIIGAETVYHADMVEVAAEAGKKIVVQKPLALTMEQADRIVAAVKKYNVPFTMAWQMHVDPQNLKMKEMMENGTLGKVYQFQRRHNLGICIGKKDPKELWHLVPSLNRDIWADDSAHPIDLIHWLFGMPESVTAELETFGNPKIVNDNGIAIFRYPGGPLVEVCCSFLCAGAEKTTEIMGEKGYLVQCYGDAVTCSMPRDENAPGMRFYDAATKTWSVIDIPSPHSQGERLKNLCKPLSEFLHGTGPAIQTAEDARDSLRLVLATYVSCTEGRRVSPDDPAIAKIGVPED